MKCWSRSQITTRERDWRLYFHSMKNTPPILDYDGTGKASYRADFWEGQGREYEDRVERAALERLLKPSSGERLLELGAGFGEPGSDLDGVAVDADGLAGCGGAAFAVEEEFKELEEHYTFELVKRIAAKAKDVGGHGGMDFIMDWR